MPVTDRSIISLNIELIIVNNCTLILLASIEVTLLTPTVQLYTIGLSFPLSINYDVFSLDFSSVYHIRLLLFSRSNMCDLLVLPVIYLLPSVFFVVLVFPIILEHY